MFFEVWDVETRNLLFDSDTIEEALDFVCEIAIASPSEHPANLALARVDGDTTTWLGHGDALLAMLPTKAERIKRQA